jgi:branched-chain amino acid transport system substrate-binding protein
MFHGRAPRVALALLGTVALTAAACAKKTTTGTGPSSSPKPSYTIAYEGPLSGGNQQLGIYMDNAVKLAVQDANNGTTFGTLPFTLKFEDSDDQGSADSSPTAATKIIQDSSVVAMIGPAFSGATRAAEPLLSQAGLASISPSATAADLTTHGWTNFFRVVANDTIQASADSTYLAKVVKPTSVYVVNDASAYGQPLAASMATDLTAAGIKVTQQTAPGTTQCQAGTGSTTQYASLASVIKSSGAQALFYGGYYCDLALFAKALNAAGFTGTIMSDDGAENTQLISQAGQSVAQGILTSCACATTLSTTAGQAFDAAYQKLTKTAAGTYSAESYDATNAVISIMKSISGPITRAAVVAGLKTVNYPGITKTIQFTSTGDISGNAVYMYKVEGANLTQLGLVSSLVGP